MNDLFADVDSITSNLNVSYVYVDELEAPAAATYQNGVRLILIDRSFLEKIPDNVLRMVAEAGLRFHEGCEHRYHNLPLRNEILEQRKVQGLNVSVWATIENILGDVHIEAKGAKDCPNLLKYLSFVLTRLYRMQVQDEELKPTSESELDRVLREVVEKVRKRNGVEVNPALIKTMHAFFEASRFGAVQKKHLDENVLADLRFIIPRVFLARRGIDSKVIFQAADEIYHFLDRKYRIPPQLSIKIVVSTPSSGGIPDGRDFEQILPWRTIEDVKKDVENAITEAKNKLVEAERCFGSDPIPGGLLGGKDHAKLTPPTMRDIQFYVDTVQKHRETIGRLQSLFKRLAGRRWLVPAREGDLNTTPSVLQQAYVDSFKSGEDERDYYLVMRHAIPDIDLVLAEDQSGCCHPATQVQLADGNIVPIKSIYNTQRQLKALTFNFQTGQFCAKPIVRTFRRAAPSHLFEVDTLLTNGLFTKEHRFFVLEPTTLQIKEKLASQLKVGERILTSATCWVAGALQPLPRPRRFAYAYGQMKGWRMPKIPKLLTPSFAQLLGYLTGDGAVAIGTVYATDKDRRNLRVYKKIVENTIGLPSQVKMRGGRLRLLINNRVFASYIKTHFPQSSMRSRKRIISSVVLKSPSQVVAKFLRGEFDAEATLAHHSILFLSTSRILAIQTQLALTRFGIASTRYIRVQSERRFHGYTVKKTRITCVTISDPESIAQFAKKIGFSHPTKKRKLRQLLRELAKIERRSRMVTLPLADAVRRTMSLVAFSRQERRRFKLNQYLYRASGMGPAKRYLSLLNTKLAQMEGLSIVDADLVQLTDACQLLHVPFSKLANLTGIRERRLVGRVYTIRHKIYRGKLAAQRAHAIAETIRSIVLGRRGEVMTELSEQLNALRELLGRIETGKVRLVKVRRVHRRRANTKFVYDLEVAETHNYLANDAITHNSMFSSAEVVGEASVCILEAAKRVGKIRTAVVSFGDGIRVLKDFNEPVAAGRFSPQAGGGTPLGSALEQALKFRWRWGNLVRHVLVICTDGYPDPDQWPIIDRALLEIKNRRIVPVALCIDVEANDEYRSRFDQVYEVKETAGDLFPAFLDSFVKNALLTNH